MGFRSASGIVLLLAVCGPTPLTAQQQGIPARMRQPGVPVPFAGCKSDGQTGPVDPPKATIRSFAISREAARQLAYYKSAFGPGVLAPSGWHCFGTYGSGGETLIVSPKAIDTEHIFSTGPGGLGGPAVQVTYTFGGTSGRFHVAEIIARIFPAYRAFADAVMKEMREFEPPDNAFVFAPYPSDALDRKSETVVEYRTAAQAEGLGTDPWLPKNDSPIDGVAILVGPDPNLNLLLLAARLPPALKALTSVIVGQVEQDAARHPGGY